MSRQRTRPVGNAPSLDLWAEGTPPDLITYREVGDRCDPVTLRRVLDHGRHYSTGGCRSALYWAVSEFEELLELVAFEGSGGAG